MPIYMKFGSINGEVTAKGYEKWIELTSLQFGVGRGVTATTRGESTREASTPIFSEVAITKDIDASSGLLFQEAYGGEAKEVKIECTQTDNKGSHVAYLKLTFTNTLITGYSTSGSSTPGGGDLGRPSETLSLNFTKIEYDYHNIDDKFNAKSTGRVMYDIAKAKGG